VSRPRPGKRARQAAARRAERFWHQQSQREQSPGTSRPMSAADMSARSLPVPAATGNRDEAATPSTPPPLPLIRWRARRGRRWEAEPWLVYEPARREVVEASASERPEVHVLSRCWGPR